MFTGIIEGLGKISSIKSLGQSKNFAIEANFSLKQTKIGDSIAVNGVCLTAVSLNGNRFEVDVSPETLATSSFNKAKVGDNVNLERALRLADRLDGHIVSGHIDSTGIIIQKKYLGNVIVIDFSIPKAITRYMIKKGSVAVDGISLTINDCTDDSFQVCIIPHTAIASTISLKKKGDTVNIETDMIGKYVERLLNREAVQSQDNKKPQAVDLKFLLKTGFV